MQLLAEECVSHMLRVAGCILHRSRCDDAGSCSDLHPRLRAIMMCMVVCAKKCDSATYACHGPGEHGVYAGNDGLERDKRGGWRRRAHAAGTGAAGCFDIWAAARHSSRTQAWCYDAAVASSVGGARYGPSSGCTSATVAGLSFGSRGWCRNARVGRGAASSSDVTGALRQRGERRTWSGGGGRSCSGGGSRSSAVQDEGDGEGDGTQ